MFTTKKILETYQLHTFVLLDTKEVKQCFLWLTCGGMVDDVTGLGLLTGWGCSLSSGGRLDICSYQASCLLVVLKATIISSIIVPKISQEYNDQYNRM